MNAPEDRDRLRALEERIDRAKTARAPSKPHQETHYSQAQLGWRMVIELVAGLAIGCGIGYGLDRLLGTIPVMLVLFTLLGFAAGVQTMLRTAREVQSQRRSSTAETDDTP